MNTFYIILYDNNLESLSMRAALQCLIDSVRIGCNNLEVCLRSLVWFTASLLLCHKTHRLFRKGSFVTVRQYLNHRSILVHFRGNSLLVHSLLPFLTVGFSVRDFHLNQNKLVTGKRRLALASDAVLNLKSSKSNYISPIRRIGSC